MTVQVLFDRMMLHANQLSLLAGGDDVARGLVAINLCQDWFEQEAAKITGLLQSYQTVQTIANQDYIAWPSDLLRLDSLWPLDSSGRKFGEPLEGPNETVGDNLGGSGFLVQLQGGSVTSGRPFGFTANGQGSNIEWDTIPDAVYDYRLYGLWAKADYTTAANTFLYPDTVALSIAPHAAAVFQHGLDRIEQSDVYALAKATFKGVAAAMSRQVRMGGEGKAYAYTHST